LQDAAEDVLDYFRFAWLGRGYSVAILVGAGGNGADLLGQLVDRLPKRLVLTGRWF
jgi:hypothetical protein